MNSGDYIKLDDYIKLNVGFSIMTLLKHTLIYNKIDSMKNRGNEDDSYT
jgi:hypothetical protein